MMEKARLTLHPFFPTSITGDQFPQIEDGGEQKDETKK